MKSRAVIVLLSLFAVSSAFAKVEVAAKRFVVIDANVCEFRIRGYKLSKPIEEAIVFGVSRIIDTYSDTFSFRYRPDFKLKIIIIGDKDEFIEYQKERRIDSSISQTGYYSHKYREVVIWKNEKTTKMVGVLFHEASHLILRHHVSWVPKWLNEGLAEYFEGLDVIGENKRVFLQQRRHRRCKRWIEEGFPIELEEYLGLSRDEWKELKKKDSKTAYDIGYSLVYFMMSRERTEKVLKELLWEFKRRGKKADSLEVINKCYPDGFEKFKRMWLNWIPRARPYRPLRALRKEAEKSSEEPQSQPQGKTLRLQELIDFFKSTSR